MTDFNRRRWACVKANNDFIFIETYSGYFNCLPDSEGKSIFLSHETTDENIGLNLLQALNMSRMIDPKKNLDFFNFKDRVAIQYKNWVISVMERFSYKTKRALFKDMRHCLVEELDGTITIKPSHHVKLEAWNEYRITEQDYVLISLESSPVETGVALRLALSRCT